MKLLVKLVRGGGLVGLNLVILNANNLPIIEDRCLLEGAVDTDGLCCFLDGRQPLKGELWVRVHGHPGADVGPIRHGGALAIELRGGYGVLIL